jgi:hypothetical protein
VVATLGYIAFLAGPPLIGRLGNVVGVARPLPTAAAAPDGSRGG